MNPASEPPAKVQVSTPTDESAAKAVPEVPFEIPDTSGEAQIEADNGLEDDNGSDDGYESASIGSDTTSITSSIQGHTFENGRRYHKFRDGKYVMPNDESEQGREDMKHAMVVKLTRGKLHLAPVGDHPQNIIDLGTGTGIWAIESKCQKALTKPC